MPHKLAAFAICDRVEDSARRAGAVNTLKFESGGITGANTDGYGFIENLRAHGVDPAAGPALVLGAGGAARAIAAALQAEGATVTICNRSPEHAAALAGALPPAATCPWTQRAAALRDHAAAHPTLGVADIVYAPLETPLLAAARARNLRNVEGLGMLLHQAVPGFAAWFGVTPAVDDELYRIVAGA